MTHKYILTHKDMEPVEGYEILDNRNNTELDHRIWSELAGMQLLFNRIMNEKNENGMATFNDNDFISLSHYRRRIDPDCTNRFYIPQPIMFQESLASQYAQCHNIEDLQLCGQALKEEFPHLVQLFEQVLNGNIFIPYNIAILSVSQFKDYCNFLFKVLDNLHKKIGTETYEDRLDYIKRYPEKYTGKNKNNDPVYQARIEAFCSERLSTFYWLYVSKQIPVFPAKVNLLEKGQKI